MNETDHYEAGNDLFKQGKFDDAIEEYKKAVEINPDYAAAFRNWGLALSRLNRHEMAIPLFEKAIGISASYIDAYNDLGIALAALKRYSEAIDAYKKAIAIDPNYAFAYTNWASALTSQGHYADAIPVYLKLIGIDGNNADAYNNLGIGHYNLKQFGEAIAAYTKALELNPGFIHAWNNLGLVFSNQGKLDEASDAYKKALDIDPSYPEALIGLGNVYFSRNDYDGAIENFRRAAEAKSGYAVAFFNWGLSLANQGKYDEAISKYRQAIEADNEYADAYNALGYALFSQRKYAEAIDLYRKALELKPEFVQAMNNWGLALLNQGNHRDAVAMYEKAIDMDEAFTQSWYNRGYALCYLKDYEGAIRDFEKTIELDSRFGWAYIFWGSALADQGRHGEAMEVCRTLLATGQLEAYALNNIAAYLDESGDYVEGKKAWLKAVDAYERALDNEEKYRNTDFFYYYGAMLHENIGDAVKAEKALLRGLAIDPCHTGILTQLVKLYLSLYKEPGQHRIPYGRNEVYEKARVAFRKAERVFRETLTRQDDVWTLHGLGSLHMLMEEDREAKNWFEKAVARDPGYDPPHFSLGLLLLRMGDDAGAVEYLETALRRRRFDFTIRCALAQVYLKQDPQKLISVEKAEKEYRKILKTARDHLDALMGMGDVCMAKADISEKDYYEMAITNYDRAIFLAERKEGSKPLDTRTLSVLHYSAAYARIRLYEASRPFPDEALLVKAHHHVTRSVQLDPENFNAEMAKKKLDTRLRTSSKRWRSDKLAFFMVFLPAVFVFLMAQVSFYFLKVGPFVRLGLDPITVGSYISLTFGSLIFTIVGLYLPDIQKLKGAGIELEKGTAPTQTVMSVPLGISKPETGLASGPGLLN
jgi:tetratricopeptide (TPR) repeat protein